MANAIVQQINAEMEELQKQLSQFKSSVEYLNNAKSQVSHAVDAVSKAEDNFNQRVKELQSTYNSFIQLTDAVEAVIKKIDTVNFPERLDNIQITVKETIKNLNEIKDATITEVQKAANAITKADFDGRFSKLQSGIEESVNSNRELADGIHKIKIPEKIDEFERTVTKRIGESYKEVEKNTKQIADNTSNAILNLNLPVRIDKLDANIAGIMSSIQNVQGRIDGIERNVIDKIKDSTDKQMSSLITLQEKVLEANLKYRKIQQSNFMITWVIVIVCFIIYYFLSH